MAGKLSLDPFALEVQSFAADSGYIIIGGEANTVGRDCTYEPVCPKEATVGYVVAGPKTFEPGCTTPDLCPNQTAAVAVR